MIRRRWREVPSPPLFFALRHLTTEGTPMMKYPLGQHRARALLRRLGITLALLAPACAGEPSGLQPPPPALSVLSGTATFPGARVRTLDIANIRATASIGGAL